GNRNCACVPRFNRCFCEFSHRTAARRFYFVDNNRSVAGVRKPKIIRCWFILGDISKIVGFFFKFKFTNSHCHGRKTNDCYKRCQYSYCSFLHLTNTLTSMIIIKRYAKITSRAKYMIQIRRNKQKYQRNNSYNTFFEEILYVYYACVTPFLNNQKL